MKLLISCNEPEMLDGRAIELFRYIAQHKIYAEIVVKEKERFIERLLFRMAGISGAVDHRTMLKFSSEDWSRLTHVSEQLAGSSIYVIEPPREKRRRGKNG